MQDILRGRFLAEGVSPRDWLHAILAALDRDIGCVRGLRTAPIHDRSVIAHDRRRHVFRTLRRGLTEP